MDPSPKSQLLLDRLKHLQRWHIPAPIFSRYKTSIASPAELFGLVACASLSHNG